ncbi:putative MFS transporter [Paramagnetospirillum magnetotacticum MS-1]|uniref:Putative MFS transporter n=1 Tax=Paramagnetospirillum magnetotacticum MS-1 TaxID=272627 RepID=A0A0C2V016_PARME|nr:MFS transporter [Paramagnetospirillum magnetotacticum]KIL98436.1 putative MFS transporter [Paramagnetospirillum magnetotacticum MS-1]
MNPERTSWPAILMAVGAGVAAAFQVGKAPIALPFIRAEMGLDLSQAAWILSIFAVMGAGVGAGMGTMVTRLGSRRLLPVGLFILALGSLAGGVLPGFPGLLAARVVEGIGYMLVVIAAPALITLLSTPAQRQMAFGLWGAFMPFGMAVSMTAAPALPLLGWRGLWLGMAGLLVAYGLLVHYRMPRPPRPPRPLESHVLRDVADTLKAPGPLLLAATFIPYSATYAALTGFLPTLLIERMGVTPGTAGLMAAGVAGVNIIGNVATGPALRLGLPRRKVMAAAFAVMMVGCLGIFPSETPPSLAYGLCLLVSACAGLLPGCILGSASIYAPRLTLVPVTLGLFMQGSNWGQLLGPVVVGAAVSAHGWPAASLVLGTATLGGVILALALRRAGKEP